MSSPDALSNAESSSATGRPTSLAPRARFVHLLGAWAFFLAASPGVVWKDGSVVLATCAIPIWALAALRPGRRAFLVEWLAAAIGLSATVIWSTKVLWITLLAVAIVPAAYVAFAGSALRRLRDRAPLWLAIAAAWVGLETLRTIVEPPFGFGWMRLGHHAHATDWLASSARVWGVGGISFALAAFGGAIAHAWIEMRRNADANSATRSEPPATHGSQAGRTVLALAPALGPLALAVGFGLAFSPPRTEPGPRVMLVQPAFAQERKMVGASPEELLRDCLELTHRGLDAAARSGERPPDIVAWGESMFPYPLVDAGLDRAYADGARGVAWAADEIDARWIASSLALEREVVGGILCGDGVHRLLPRGASFVTGADLQALRDGAIRRWNVVIGWNPRGERIGWGSKLHLVPGGEALCGLERLQIVRDLAFQLANYVPDFVSGDETGVLAFPRSSAAGSNAADWRASVSVCFDNAFEDPYASALRAGPIDFHLICSNEAWYEESFEYDQMIAFSRLLAIATGRSFVRATNAGISVVIDPSGAEVARLTVDGKDRMVPGTLRADVPVPVEAERERRTPFVRLERWWIVLWIGLPLLLAFLPRRRQGAGADVRPA